MKKKKVFEWKLRNVIMILSYLVALGVAIYSSVYQGGFIDSLVKAKGFNSTVLMRLSIMLGLMLASAVLNILFVQYLPLRRNLLESMKAGIGALKSVLGISQKQYEEKDKGYYLNVVTNSSFSYGDLYSQLNIELPGSIISLAFLIVVMGFINPIFSIIYVVYIPLYLWLSNKPNAALADYQRRGLGTQDAYIDECKQIVENKRVININKVDDYYEKRIVDKSHAFNDFVQKYRFFQIVAYNLPDIMSRIIQVVTIGVSAYLFFEGKFTVGSIFMMYQLSNLLQEPMSRCIQIWTYVSVSKVHLERLGELDILVGADDSFDKVYCEKDNLVEVNSGDFYTDGKREIKLFSAKDLTIPKNGLTLIKGENGSGKSRFVDFITGYSDVESFLGEIAVDSELKSASYLSYPVLTVDGDLQENMMGKEINKEIYDCLDITFDNKEIDSKVNNLSFGETQKLNLLRTFSQDSEVYVLDEPFTNLDKKSIRNLSDYIGRIKNEKGIVAIVHSNDLDKYADQIITITDKELVLQEA